MRSMGGAARVVSQPLSAWSRGACNRAQPTGCSNSGLRSDATRFRGEQGDAVLDEFEPDACL